MNIKSPVIMALAVMSLIPFAANAKKKGPEKGMLEKMEAVPCGARQRGFTGLGNVWASVGITAVNSNEKLCPQYLVRTDNLEYEIRPTDGKHPVVLPIGHEGQFTVRKDRMYLMVETATDRRTRAYQVVGVKQTNAESAATQDSSGPSTTKSSTADPSTTTKGADASGSSAENKTPGANQTTDTNKALAEANK